MTKSKSTLTGTIDRVESGVAIILVGSEGDDVLEIPVSWLPEGAGEGDLVTIGIQCSPDKTKKAKEEVANLIRKLQHK